MLVRSCAHGRSRPQLHGKLAEAGYAFHMAIDMALGYLFLSGGTASLGRCKMEEK